MAAVFALSFASCAEDSGGTGNLTGYWKSDYGDGFKVENGVFTAYDNETLTEGAVSFAGTIVRNTVLNAETGSLTLQITSGGSWSKTPDYYYVVKWKNLTETSVQYAAAAKYVSEGSLENDFAPGKPTQTEAEGSYTSSAGYFAQFGSYTKQ